MSGGDTGHAPHTVVVGAGAAGCSAAYRLRQLGHRVTVIEAQPDIGGRTRSTHLDGFVIDTGAAYIASFYERTLALIHELGREDELRRMRAPAGFHDGGKTHLVFTDRASSYLRSGIVGWRDKLRVARLPFRRDVLGAPGVFDLDGLAGADTGESLGDWGRRTCGERAYTHTLAPPVESAFCVPADDLASVFFRAGLRHGRGARQFCLASGMGSLCDWLLEGADPRTGTPVAALHAGRDEVQAELVSGESISADSAVVATEATVAAALLGPALPGFARESLAASPHACSVHVALAFDRDPWPDAPLGVAVPVGPGRDGSIACVSRQSRKAPGLVPHGAELVDVFLTGEASRTLDDEAARRMARRGVARLLGEFRQEPMFEHVYRREAGLALPCPGHYRAVRAVLESLPPRVRLAGDYLTHSGVEAAIVSGEMAAVSLASAGGEPQSL